MNNVIQWNLLLRELGLLVGGVLIAALFIHFDVDYAASVVALIATVQLGFFLSTTFHRVFNHIEGDNMSIPYCLGSLAVMILVFVLTYAMNYFLITLADGAALKNFDPPSLFYRLIDSLYFSTVTFTATGFGEYVPMSYPAKVVVWGEMVLGFATTVFAVSTFISLTNKD